MSPFSFSYFFSYWIFAWFLLYEIGWIHYNPYLWLWIAFIINWGFSIAMIYYKNDVLDIFLFSLINILIKGIPIWLLRDSVIRNRDIQAGLILLTVYFAYLAWNNRLFRHNMFYLQLRAVQTNQPITPIVSLVKKWMAKMYS